MTALFFVTFFFCLSSVRPAYAFLFVSWGDTKTGTAALTALSNQAKALSPNFNIYTGDLIDSGTGAGTLDTWKNALNGGTNNGTFDITFPVRGNHDKDTSTIWPNYFNLQGVASRIGATNYSELNPDATYSFDYGNSHIAGIDVLGDVTSISAAQITWLDNDLTAAENRGLTHAFLFWHGPIYAVDGHCCPTAPSDLITVFNKHPIISASFHGHEHVLGYVHMDSTRISSITHPFEEFVTGAAGANLYSCSAGKSDWCLASNGFATINVSGASFTVNVYQQGSTTPVKTWNFTKPATDPVLVGAGDIVNESNPDPTKTNAMKTAALIQSLINRGGEVHVFTAGDNLNTIGNMPSSYYGTYFDPTWGQFKNFIRPATGNHDYNPLPDGSLSYAKGYFDYFNTPGLDPPPAGTYSLGYYSYNIGSWHIVVLNSNCNRSDACVTSPTDTTSTTQKWINEENWLTRDLEANKDKVCTAAYWHHPLFSSGQWGNTTSFVKPLWDILYNYGVDIVLNGHSHDYERFAPQTASGTLDTAHGIREFVVGTGGLANFQWADTTNPTPKPNSEFLTDNVNHPDLNGVLKLTLHPSSYDWEFDNIGGSITDSGTSNCVTPPPSGGDTQAPTAPTNLTATAASATQVNLSWTASTDNVAVTGYKVFRGGSQIGTSTTNSYSDTTVQAATSYSYYVTAYDAAGNNSAASNTAPVTTPCAAIPTDKGKVTTRISISTVGDYRVWSRIMVPDANNNSYILQVDNDCGTVVGTASTIAANTWAWVDYKDASSSSKITMSLTTGSHTINMIGKGAGVKLDRLIFTTDLTCVPTDTGDNCLGQTVDTTPPVRSNGSPSGAIAAGTTQATLSLNTDEAATCKYATSVGVSYGSMSNTFLTTGGTSHSTTVTGLTNGGSYKYYVRCQDKASPTSNANTDDYLISFTVNASPTTKVGDLNNDNYVNAADLQTLVNKWGTTDAVADINKDNTVNIFDLSILLSNWGK